MQDPSTASWIALLRDGRASRILSPANASGSKTSDGSGLTSPESSGSAALQSSLEKTCLGSSVTPTAVLRTTVDLTTGKATEAWTTTQTDLWGAWEPFCGIWPRWGLCLHGECYELPKWEPATAARESSSSPSSQEPKACSRNTPRTISGGAESAERKQQLGRTESGGGDLQAQTEAWAWPTPRAEDSESTGAHRGNLDTLNSATRNWEASSWMTPKVQDTRHATASPSEAERHSPTLAAQVTIWQTPAVDSFRSRGGDRKDEMGLDQQARFWPTPNANPEAPNNSTTRENGREAQRLTDQCLGTRASAWPTPANRDSRDPNLLSYQERSDSTKGEQLNNFVAHQWKTPHGLQFRPEDGDPGGGGEFAKQACSWSTDSDSSLPAPQIQFGLTFSQRLRILLPLCRQLRRLLPSPYRKAGSIFKRKLNPNFVDWLMGWPAGWSSVDRAYSAEEMELYLSRQRWCLESSLGGLD